MLQFSFAIHEQRSTADAIVVPVYQEKNQTTDLTNFPPKLLATNPSLLQAWQDHSGKEGELTICYLSQQVELRCILVGMGKAQTISNENLRKAYAAVIKLCQSKKWTTLNLLLPTFVSMQSKQIIELICEGLLLANYRFDRYKSKPSDSQVVEQVNLLINEPFDTAATARMQTIAAGVYLARDLVNGNACEITPQYLAQTAQAIAQAHPDTMTTTLYDRSWIAEQQMGLLLAVSEGGKQEPVFITIEYRGAAADSAPSVIVGKGVTFDSGGLNLKPTGSMETMKCDMAGAAAVLGTLQVIAALQLPVNVVGVIPATENDIDAQAYKPGDVYRGYNGKTVEIISTDAEGRLILADAMAYACQRYQPKEIIDLATLTGAVVIALGGEASGLMSNDAEIITKLTRVGVQTHERVWPLPVFEEYKELIKSDIADLKNAGGRPAGTISAGLFLQEFIGETPWAHLDIAGTAYLNKAKSYHPTLATGVGVRLLTAYFASSVLHR